MADSKKKVIIEVDLLDKASKGFSVLDKTVSAFGKTGKAVFKAVGLAVAGATATVTGAIVAVETLGKRAGAMEGLALGFERNFGDMEKSLASFRKASAGMVSDFDLMQTANRASLLGVTSDVDELSQLMVTARLRGREMGIDMTQAFDDIVTGIGRGSPLILDNLGIKIPDALKETMKSMDEAEKTTALLNFAIEDGARIAKEYGQVNLTTAERVAIMNAQFTNFKDSFASAISPLLSFIAMGLTPLAEALQYGSGKLAEFIDGLGIDFEERVTAGMGFIHDWYKENEENFTPSIEKLSEKLGINGEGGLAGAIKALFYPTDEEKKKLKQMMTEGLDRLLDLLVKDGGVIDQMDEFVQTIADFDVQNMKIGIETAIDLMENLVYLTGKAVDLFKILEASGTVIKSFTEGKEGGEYTSYTVDNNYSGEPKPSLKTNTQKVSDMITDLNTTPNFNIADKYLKRASGGMAGGLTMVGENGAELVNLPNGSHVYNNTDSKRIGGSGGITINVNAPVTGVDNLKASIIEAVNVATARQNRLAEYNLL